MLALAIMGLLPPSARTTGSIKLQGQELLSLTERELCGSRQPDRYDLSGAHDCTQSGDEHR